MNEDRDLPRLTEIGEFLKILRKQKGLSQDQLAARCDLTKSNISNIENGKKDFNFTTFLEYAKGLQLPPKELLNKDFEFPKSYMPQPK
ncbi:Helix-turn-helix domain-containing protein [Mucilaginibacter pineti]|uniref:Helix-turn-helix domain-containing protein n=1 Tax=Mucilaginibacter pineti TaxID=1391627 RepID=A0A1G7P3Y7_9SPHI|nr:helix-turn-helix transcriptional regulator [Mucilaginibacter pineti]SDF81016.1 Helix-turn-helix domain-containing protein [Mucilaginibacter pineti]